MKAITRLILPAILAVLVLPQHVLAQNSGAAANPNGMSTPIVHSALEILSPKSGELLKQDFVTVKYDLSNSGIAGGSPNFRVRLDGRETVITTFDSYTFTGVRPGEHTLRIELVDANNNPIANASAEVHFNTANPGATSQPAPSAPASAPPQVRQTSFSPAADDGLPKSGSALPLLSVIGFGVLVGGIASTLKTR